MIPLDDQQQQLIFDHALGLTAEGGAAEAEKLLASHPEAAGIHRTLRDALSPLDSLPEEVCPDDLAERTVSGLLERVQIGSGRDRLEQLLEAEQEPHSRIRIPFWRNWGDIATVAAVLVLVVGVLLPTLSYTRQRYWRQQCQTQLAGVHGGLASYVADHEGRLPSVPTPPGSPWWKVGYQGAENHSNTRRAWLLVKQGYVEPSRFICPGRREDRDLRLDTLEVANYNDFPGRAYIHFSIRVGCPQSGEQRLVGRKVLFADLNPLAERLPSDHSAAFNLRMCQDLLTSNSRNHNRRGQNVLFCDGSVEFARRRHTSISEDDIYVLTNMTDGCEVRGCEVPSCETDAFLAP